MDANVIKQKIEDAWQDASAHWKDEMAKRYHAACIPELENILENIRVVSAQLNESADTVTTRLRKYNY